MITDPLTLGVAGNVNTFALTEQGPGARTVRPTTSAAETLASYIYDGMTLTISHETNRGKTRRRSLVRLDFSGTTSISLQTPGPVAPPFAYLVVDRPIDDLNGDTATAAKKLLSRILGFLTANATAAPDHTFAAAPHVGEWLRGEP
jgi:hypothetical protein